MGYGYDVAVVGAGVLGAWTALGLARRGQRVLLIEAWAPGHSRSCSGDESRIVRAGYGLDSFYTRLALRSLPAWRELDAGSPAETAPLFHPTGVLWFGRAEDDRVAQTAITLAAEAAPHERLTTSELARRFPQLGLEGIAWGLLEPESGAVLARRSVASVVARAVAAGARLRRGRVVAEEPADGGAPRLTLDGAPLAAERVVLACGPWLPSLLPRLLGDRITPTRQEVFYLGAPGGDGRFVAPALPVLVDFAEEFYVIPDLEGRGVKVGIDAHGPAIDPDTAERTPDPALLARVRMILARRLPALAAAPLLESRVCQYENTSSGDLLADVHPADPRLWIVGGGSGHGFKHAPALAEHLVARMLDALNAVPRLALASKQRTRRRVVF